MALVTWRMALVTWLKRLWPRRPWAAVASIVYASGAGIALGTASSKLNQGTTPQELEAAMIVYVIIGLLLSGVGQLMCATAHGTSSPCGVRYDGWGKIISLFGWSLGLLGATFLYMKGTETPAWVLGATIGFVFVPPAFTLGWSYWPLISKLWK